MNSQNKKEEIKLIKEFLKKYNQYHTEKETLSFIKNLLKGKSFELLSLELKELNKETLIKRLENIIIQEINNYHINTINSIKLLPIIIKNRKQIQIKNKPRKLTLSNKIIKKVSLIGTIITLSTIPSKINYNKDYNNDKEINSINMQNNIQKTNSSINSHNETSNIITTGAAITTGPVIATQSSIAENKEQIEYNINELKRLKKEDKKQKRLEKKQKELEKKQKEEAKKLKVLYNFQKYKTVSDILKRQKELESLNLTKKDKLYKDCKLSAAVQWFIYEQAIVHGITPPDFTFSVIDTESRGEFNSSGTQSYNAPNNYDLGLTQQNTVSSLKTFCNTYGFDYNNDEDYRYAYNLVKYNDYINIVSHFLELKEINSQFHYYDYIEYAGCYNGWLNWRNYSISREYVNIFDVSYEYHFTDYHKIEDKKQILKKANYKATTTSKTK